MSLGLFIYTWASINFNAKNKAPPACCESLLVMYFVVVCLYGCNMYGVFVERMRVLTEISCIPRRNKGFGKL